MFHPAAALVSLLACVFSNVRATQLAVVADTPVSVLGDSNFTDYLSKHEFVLVEFYAPWCGHCTSLESIFEQVAQATKDDGVVLAKVDATVHTRVSDRLEIQAYPTLKLFRNSAFVEDHSGDRTAAALTAWLRRKVAPALRLSGPDAVAAFTKLHPVSVVGEFAGAKSAELASFLLAAAHDDMEAIAFAFVLPKEIAAPSVTIRRPFGEPLLFDFSEGSDDVAVRLRRWVARHAEPPSDVVPLDAARVASLASGTDNLLVEFFAPWCGHCQQFRPIYEQLATAFKERVVVGAVDGTKNSQQMQQFGIRKFPTIRLFRKGQEAVDFSGEKTLPALSAWLTRKTQPAATLLSTPAALSDLVKSQTVLLGHFAASEGEEFLSFMSLAAHDSLDELASVYTLDSALTKPRIELVRTFNATTVAFDWAAGESAVEQQQQQQRLLLWALEHAYPLVQPVTQKSYARFRTLGRPAVILFVNQKLQEQANEQQSMFARVADKFRGQASFGVGDSERNEAHSKSLGASGTKYPTVASMHFLKDLKYGFDESQELNEETLVRFVEGVLRGSASPFYKSAELPTTPTGAVVEVVGKSWAGVADGKRNVLLQLYAPWCPHCKKLAPVYEQLAELFAGDSSLIAIAQCDGTANELPSIKVEGYPTILLLPAGGKAQAIEFDQALTLSNLVHFVLDHSTAVDGRLPALPADFEEEGEVEDEDGDEYEHEHDDAEGEEYDDEEEEEEEEESDIDVAAAADAAADQQGAQERMREGDDEGEDEDEWGYEDAHAHAHSDDDGDDDGEAAEGEVLHLGPLNFTSVVGEYRHTLVMFHSGCPACSRFLPTFQRMAFALREEMTFCLLNATRYPKLAQFYNVTSFPSLRLFLYTAYAESLPWQGQMKEAEIVAWLRAQTLSPVLHAGDATLRRSLKPLLHAVVAFVGCPACLPLAPLFTEVAFALRETVAFVRVNVSTAPLMAARYEIDATKLPAFKFYDHDRGLSDLVSYHGKLNSGDLVAWARRLSTSHVRHIGDAKGLAAVLDDFRVVPVLLVASCPPCSGALRSFERAARLLGDEVLLAVVNATETPELARRYNPAGGFPRLLFFDEANPGQPELLDQALLGNAPRLAAALRARADPNFIAQSPNKKPSDSMKDEL